MTDPLTASQINETESDAHASIRVHGAHTANSHRCNAYRVLALCEMARQAEYGPGTPHQRFQWIHDQLQSLFPDVHNPCQSDPPEPKWIEEIAKLKAERDALKEEARVRTQSLRQFYEDVARVGKERDEAIAKLPAWISCKDRMPENGQRCLAHSPAQNGYMAATWIATYWTDESPHWWLTGAEQRVDIALWMPLTPLPEPAK